LQTIRYPFNIYASKAVFPWRYNVLIGEYSLTFGLGVLLSSFESTRFALAYRLHE